MSTEAEHIALANRNQAAIEHLLLDAGKCWGWVAVVAFYKSLHVVDAVFARESTPCHLHNHHARLDRLKATRAYSLLFQHYRAMWSAALVARNLAHEAEPPGKGEKTYACFDDYLPVAEIRSKPLDRYLFGFEHIAVQLLGPSSSALNRYSKTVNVQTSESS